MFATHFPELSASSTNKLEDSVETLDRIVSDYHTDSGPYQHETFPEAAMVRSIETGERAFFLTFGSALDYQRPAERHWTKMGEIWNENQWAFSPELVLEREDELYDLFGEKGIRFPNRDAGTWLKLARTFRDRHDNDPLNLVEDVDYHAPSLVDHVQSEDGYPFLGGDKISPMWARFIHEYVDELEEMFLVDVPVDVHVRNVTAVLATGDVNHDLELSNDDVRSFWTEFCRQYDHDSVAIDKSIWLIGLNWEDWGKEYLDSNL